MTEVILNSGIRLALALALYAAAMVRGSAPERILAGTLLATTVLGMIVVRLMDTQLSISACWADLVIDLLAFGVICTTAMRANRVYPVWLGAVQIVKLTSRIWCLALAKPALRAHLMMDAVAFYTQLTIMGLGFAYHVVRSRRLDGGYPDWSPRP